MENILLRMIEVKLSSGVSDTEDSEELNIELSKLTIADLIVLNKYDRKCVLTFNIRKVMDFKYIFGDSILYNNVLMESIPPYTRNVIIEQKTQKAKAYL